MNWKIRPFLDDIQARNKCMDGMQWRQVRSGSDLDHCLLLNLIMGYNSQGHCFNVGLGVESRQVV